MINKKKPSKSVQTGRVGTTQNVLDLLERYEQISKEAFAVASAAPIADSRARIVLEMAQCYISDAAHFKKKGDFARALASLSYSHGWLDCGARLGLYVVHDDQLFTVDGLEKNKQK